MRARRGFVEHEMRSRCVPAVCYVRIAPGVCLSSLWSCTLGVYLLSQWLYLVCVRLVQVICALDVCWPSLGLCLFQLNRGRDAIPVNVLPCGMLCCPLRGSGCALSGSAPAGTMVVLALRVLAQHMIVPGRRAIPYGCARAGRVLAEPKVGCIRRMSNSRCDVVMGFGRVVRLWCSVSGPVVLAECGV